MQFPGALEFVKRYQAKAAAAGVDPLGYYIAPWAYADLQVLGQAITDTKSISDAKIAEDFHSATFHTVVGDVKFGNGRRMGNAARHPDSIPRHRRQRHRAIPRRRGDANDRDADGVQDRQCLIYPYSAAKRPRIGARELAPLSTCTHSCL